MRNVCKVCLSLWAGWLMADGPLIAAEWGGKAKKSGVAQASTAKAGPTMMQMSPLLGTAKFPAATNSGANSGVENFTSPQFKPLVGTTFTTIPQAAAPNKTNMLQWSNLGIANLGSKNNVGGAQLTPKPLPNLASPDHVVKPLPLLNPLNTRPSGSNLVLPKPNMLLPLIRPSAAAPTVVVPQSPLVANTLSPVLPATSVAVFAPPKNQLPPIAAATKLPPVNNLGNRQTQSNGSSGPNQGEGGLRAKLKLEKKGEDQQKADLNQMLGAMEQAIIDMAKKMGLDGDLGPDIYKKLQDAIDEAKKGNTKPLQDLMDEIKKKSNKAADLLTALDAFKKASDLLQEVDKDGPLDAAKLKELEDLLGKFPQPLKDALNKSFADLKNWNDILKDLADTPADPGGAVDPGLGALLDLLGLGVGGYPGAYPADAGYGAYPADAGYGAYPADPGYAVDPGYAAGAMAANAAAPPAAPSPAPGGALGGKVVLWNPTANRAGVAYVLNDQFAYEMKPGDQQELDTAGGGAWTIAFDRGGNLGEARYSLGEGTYEFTLTSAGWDLARKQYRVTIDATGLRVDFNYLLDGQPAVVKAGATSTHTSLSPVEIVFDPGDGSGPVQKTLDTGAYKIGASADQKRLELSAAAQGLLSKR